MKTGYILGIFLITGIASTWGAYADSNMPASTEALQSSSPAEAMEQQVLTDTTAKLTIVNEEIQKWISIDLEIKNTEELKSNITGELAKLPPSDAYSPAREKLLQQLNEKDAHLSILNESKRRLGPSLQDLEKVKRQLEYRKWVARGRLGFLQSYLITQPEINQCYIKMVEATSSLSVEKVKTSATRASYEKKHHNVFFGHNTFWELAEVAAISFSVAVLSDPLPSETPKRLKVALPVIGASSIDLVRRLVGSAHEEKTLNAATEDLNQARTKTDAAAANCGKLIEDETQEMAAASDGSPAVSDGKAVTRSSQVPAAPEAPKQGMLLSPPGA